MNEILYECTVCTKKYVSIKGLKEHRCKGVAPLQCEVCFAMFKTKQDKYRHRIARSCGEDDTIQEDDQPSGMLHFACIV